MKTKYVRTRQIMKRIKTSGNLYLMLLPVFIGFLFVHFFPIILSAAIGFFDYNLFGGIFESPFVGFKYFGQFINDPFFFRVVRNTLLLGLYTILWTFWPPILLAIMLQEVKSNFAKRLSQSITYIPYFLSTVVLIGIVYTMSRDGEVLYNIINSIFAKDGQSINIISNPNFFRTIYISTHLWQFMGYESIIYIAAILAIDPQLYEAAKVDGASRLQRIWHITISGIMPTVMALFIIKVGQIINVGFEKVLIMYSPAIYETADIIQTYVYRRGIEGLDFGYAGAVNLFNAVIGLILVIATNRMSKKLSDQSLW